MSEVNVSGRKGGLYFLAEIFNGRIYSNVTVITVTRKFANYCNYSNVDLSAVSTGVLNGLTLNWTFTYSRTISAVGLVRICSNTAMYIDYTNQL